MENRTKIARRIIHFGVLPFFVAFAILFIGFAVIQQQQVNNLKDQLFWVVESELEQHYQSREALQRQLTQLATAAFKVAPITQVTLVNENFDIVHNYGLPSTLRDYSWLGTETANHSSHHTAFRAIPVSTPDEQYWLVTGLSLGNILIQHYRGYLVLILAGACSAGLIVFYASRLHRSIVEPIEKIIHDLRQTIPQETPEHLNHSSSDLYNDLVDLLNDMIDRQQNIRDDMQVYVEQSTKELRETLETVEIQNIELDIARKNALQASKAKSEFLANTSHELRTPLNGVLGFTSLLLKTTLTNQQRDYLSTIEQSAQGLLTVIDDILDFSRLETGQLTLEYKLVMVRHLIEEVQALHAPQAHEKNLRLLTIIDKNVPQNLLGDPDRFKQVMTNLVSNAIKFSARGNIIVRAAMIGELDGQIEIKFSVSDNGIGLNSDQQESLFDAFSRGDATDSRLQGGAGLGLAIAKGLVNRMRGEIGVVSEPHKGSTFWFTARFGVDKKLPAEYAETNSLYGLNILVYDANPICRMELSHQLGHWGVRAIECAEMDRIMDTVERCSLENPINLLLIDSYKDEASFDKNKILAVLEKLSSQFQLPIIVLAPPSIQRILQDDVVGLNTVIVFRPIMNLTLHRAICNQLNITEPLAEPDAAEKAPRPISMNRDKIRALVVDDNPANRKLASEFLKGLNVTVECAEDGQSALSMCERMSFDLIFMDVQMPGIDGLETTRLIRSKETHKRVPVVALTAHAVQEQKTRILLAGMDDFLSKPVSERDLNAMIERWVKPGDAVAVEPVSLETPSAVDDGSSITNEKQDPSIQPLPQSSKAQFSESNGSSGTLEADTTPPSNALAEFDWQESMALAKQKPDLARDMLQMLVDSIDETVSKLESAIVRFDMSELLEVVHKFHGGCCYCGVPDLRETSKRLEQNLHNQNYETVEKDTALLVNKMRSLQKWADSLDIDSLFGDPVST